MRATGNQLIAANATGCLEVFSTPYPETSWQLPWLHSLFGNAAAVGSGIAAYHFNATSQAEYRRDPGNITDRDSTATHTQAFYIVGPELSAL